MMLKDYMQRSGISSNTLIYLGFSIWLAIQQAPAVIAQSNSCTNPNRNSGSCISVYECPALIRVLERNQQGYALSPSQRDFMRASQCRNGFGNPPHVCCTGDNDYITNKQTAPRPSTRPAQPSNGRANILPLPPHCGPVTLNNKIYGGNATALDEYPWMVLLQYTEKNGDLSFKCGGSLINQRYVLTAAHCVVGKIERDVGPLTAVHLGEYDISSEIDCFDTDCNEKVVIVGVEEAIPHPQYSDGSAHHYHDIALIRLDADVNYGYFIGPVCLPLPDYRMNINVGEHLVVAGWGRTLKVRQSNVKQHLPIAVADQGRCKQRFASRKISLIDAQLCVGGTFAQDSCDGDSGGPLMRQGAQGRWFLEGIVSFGNRCGLEEWPGVYTRVADYTDWIQSTLKP